MQERESLSIWDEYWIQSEQMSVEDIIKNDPYYLLLKRLIELPKDKKLNILEFGCGSAIRTLALLHEYKKYSLNAILIDISSAALSLGKRNADKNKIIANFIRANGLRAPFKDESFDIVWNEGVIEHFEGELRYRIFNEMTRVCKRGGDDNYYSS